MAWLTKVELLGDVRLARRWTHRKPGFSTVDTATAGLEVDDPLVKAPVDA